MPANETTQHPVSTWLLTHNGLFAILWPTKRKFLSLIPNSYSFYRLAEFNQWAEPVSNNLTRVLAENLTNLLRGDLIDVFLASDSSIPKDYRLEVDILRLDGNLGGQAVLISQWALLAAAEDELILMRRSKYQESAADNTYKELVLAKSRTVEKLSRDIAAAVKKALVDR